MATQSKSAARIKAAAKAARFAVLHAANPGELIQD